MSNLERKTPTLRNLGKVMVLYALGSFLQRIGTLILVPLYTSVLLVSEYGALETIMVTLTILSILINLGLSNSLIRFYPECNREEDIYEMIRTSWVLVIVFSFVLFFLIRPFFGQIGLVLLKDKNQGELIAATFIWAIGGALNQQFFSYYRARQDARGFIIVSILFFLASTLLNILLVRFMNMNLAGVIYGNLIAVWSINLIATIKFFGCGRSISVRWAKKLIGFGFPLVFGMLGWLILNSADRYFLAYYRDLPEVGIYGLGYKVGLIAQMTVVLPFQLAWPSYIFSVSLSSGEDAKAKFSRIFTYLLAGFCFVGLGIYLFSNEIVFLLGSGKFAQSAEVIPYVLVAYLFSVIYYWSGSFLYLTNKSTLASAILIAMAGLNLYLNWTWIPIWGWKGAAWATVVAVGGAGIFTLLAGEWAYPIKLQYVRMIKLFLTVCIIALVHSLVDAPSLVLNLLMLAVLLLCMPLLLILVRFFESFEIRFMLNLLELARRKLIFVKVGNK